MRKIISSVLLASAIAASPIFAQSTIAIHVGAMVTTVDGKRLGRIYEVEKARDGTVTSVSIVHDSRIIRLPAQSLSSGNKGLITSLTRAELKPKS